MCFWLGRIRRLQRLKRSCLSFTATGTIRQIWLGPVYVFSYLWHFETTLPRYWSTSTMQTQMLFRHTTLHRILESTLRFSWLAPGDTCSWLNRPSCSALTRSSKKCDKFSTKALKTSSRSLFTNSFASILKSWSGSNSKILIIFWATGIQHPSRLKRQESLNFREKNGWPLLLFWGQTSLQCMPQMLSTAIAGMTNFSRINAWSRLRFRRKPCWVSYTRTIMNMKNTENQNRQSSTSSSIIEAQKK